MDSDAWHIHSYNVSIDIMIFIIGTWSRLEVTGKCPPVTGDFSLTMIDSHRAVMYGGYLGRAGFTNDTYILDLEKMVCTGYMPYVDTMHGTGFVTAHGNHAAAL